MNEEYIESPDDASTLRVPRPLLAGAGTLAAIALIAAAVGRKQALANPADAAPPLVSRALLFEDAADGAVLVKEAGTQALVARIAVGEGGFVRGTLRSLARQRTRAGVGADVPFTLSRTADGRIALDDAATGNHVDLTAFGPTNAASFARLLKDAKPAP